MAGELLKLVESMRAQQRRYYKSRSQLDLIKMVDDTVSEERQALEEFKKEFESVPEPEKKQERFRDHAKTVAKMARVVMAELLKDPDPAWRELAKDWEDEFRRLAVDLEDMEKDFCEECGEEVGECLCEKEGPVTSIEDQIL